ncbi:MAG: SixA phosphatase family protein [Cyclobacteriaceae bacterium]
MKTLDIIRHAKSSWNFQSLDDYSRPLGVRGRRDLKKFSKYITKHNLTAPELIVTSPASRAFYTALHLADAWEYKEESVQLEAALYHADEEETIEVVHEYGHISHLAIVGHNPGLTGLINVLSKQFLENLPTCGIVRSTFAVDSWEEISPETIMSQYRYFPKIL